MDVIQAIKTRRSVRSYQDKPVEPEKLQQILEAARLAPSACNYQEWKFIVVQDVQTRQALARACHNQAFIGRAPLVIAACSTNPTRMMASGQPAPAVDPHLLFRDDLHRPKNGARHCPDKRFTDSVVDEGPYLAILLGLTHWKQSLFVTKESQRCFRVSNRYPR